MDSKNDQDDRLAARAARAVLEGDAKDVRGALERLGVLGRLEGLARKHLEGLRASRGGDASLALRRRERLEGCLAIMEAIDDLELRLADDRWIHRGVRLAGRITTGRFDPGEPVHLRQHGDRPLHEIESELGDIGATELVRCSVRTRFGVLSSLHFLFEGGEFRCRRCPPDQVPLESRDLFHDRPVSVTDLNGLQRLISAARAGG
jgi:hypothetical protein